MCLSNYEKGKIFYVVDGKLSGTEIQIDYIQSNLIGGKGVHIGMRYEEGIYVPLTMLVDRAVNPTKTLTGLKAVKVHKLEIIEDGKIIEVIQAKI